MYQSQKNDYSYGYEPEIEELDPYLTPREVMELLYIGKNTVYKLLKSGELKGFRVGKQWRVTRESLGQFSAE